MYKKVNIEALCEAIVWQNPLCYNGATAEQYKTLVYITPGSYDYSVEDIIGISMGITGRWNEISVTSPNVTDTIYRKPRLFVCVSDLLPQFIVEGEEWIDESDSQESIDSNEHENE